MSFETRRENKYERRDDAFALTMKLQKTKDTFGFIRHFWVVERNEAKNDLAFSS